MVSAAAFSLQNPAVTTPGPWLGEEGTHTGCWLHIGIAQPSGPTQGQGEDTIPA